MARISSTLMHDTTTGLSNLIVLDEVVIVILINASKYELVDKAKEKGKLSLTLLGTLKAQK